MLILTRRPTQTLKIGPKVAITVLEIVGNRVRLGIEAPRDVRIRRKEGFIAPEPDNPIGGRNSSPDLS
jgi:carbon storage regulator